MACGSIRTPNGRRCQPITTQAERLLRRLSHPRPTANQSRRLAHHHKARRWLELNQRSRPRSRQSRRETFRPSAESEAGQHWETAGCVNLHLLEISCGCDTMKCVERTYGPTSWCSSTPDSAGTSTRVGFYGGCSSRRIWISWKPYPKRGEHLHPSNYQSHSAIKWPYLPSQPVTSMSPPHALD
jgi:hypothetical protein